MKPVLVACLLVLASANLVHAGPAPNKAPSSALAGTTWRGFNSLSSFNYQVVLKFQSPPIVFREQQTDFAVADLVGWYNYLSSKRLVAVHIPAHYYIPVTTFFGRVDSSGRTMTGVLVEDQTAYMVQLTRQ